MIFIRQFVIHLFILICCFYYLECASSLRHTSKDRLFQENRFARYDEKEDSKEKELYKPEKAIEADSDVQKISYDVFDIQTTMPNNMTDPSDPNFMDKVWTILGHTTLIAAGFFIIFGGVIPFIFQYVEIRKRNSAKGFSLYVCLTQLIAHTLRIMFWFGKHFELQLLAQAVVMLIAMWILIHTAVNTTRRHITYPYKGVTVWTGHMISHFWAWTDFGSYFFVYTLFLCTASIVTATMLVWPLYVEAIGFAALLIEANLGSPQAIRNWQRKSTEGMSVKMVLAWMCGDIGKTAYFFVRNSPPQFWVCGIIQICIDVIIMGQVIWYGRKSTSI